MKEDKHFRDWYKKKVESHSEEPPGKIWENIQDELDIDNAWQNISEELKHQDRIVFLRNTSYAAAAAAVVVLFLLVFIPAQIIDENYNRYSNAIENKTYPIPPEILQEKGTFNALVDRDNREPSLEKNMISTLEQPYEDSEMPNIEAGNASNQSKSPDPELSSLQTGNIRLAYNAPNTGSLIMSDAITQDEMSTDEQSNKTKFYVGAAGQFGNTWLLSNKTLYSIRESPYSSAEPVRNNAISLLAGINLNDRFDIQLESQFNNNNGQIYKEYAHGDFITNQIQLKYTSLVLTGRYRFIRENKNIPVSHHFVLGTYGSYLQNAYQDINENKENIRDIYKNYDLGLIVGYEVDSRLTNSLILSTSAKIDPGLINIYKGSEELPADFNQTYTTSLGVQISLKYEIR